jgi:hypothetical protein
MQVLPSDPKHNLTCAGTGAVISRCGYVYNSGTDTNGIANGSYEVSTAFENSGNVKNKAIDDGGNDVIRLEIGTLKE